MSSKLSTAASDIMPHGHVQQYLSHNTIWIINTGTILIVLPVINHLLIPLRPTTNIRLKIGVGFTLHVLSFGVASFVQWRQESVTHQQFFSWMVLTMVLLSLGETIVFVSSELISAEYVHVYYT